MDKKLQEKQFYLNNAEKIVSKLSSETLSEKETAQLIKQIEPYHYEEIVEERFVSKLCGYPCCANELTNIPTKKYQISTKLNKVFDLSDRKRYCSTECYQSSKYIEAQISTIPVWLRNTPEFLKNEGAQEIKFWSSTVKQKSQKLIQKPIQQKLVKDNIKETEKPEVIKNLTSEIENELKQIERDWIEKIKLKQDSEASALIVSKNKNEQVTKEKIDEQESKLDADLKERSELLKKKFIESMEIHKKPSDFSNLKQIFLFEIKKENQVITLGQGKTKFEICEKNLSQLYFIEYIIQRIRELISIRTKNYLLQKESKDKPSINEEREREEYLEACDKLVSKKTAFFSDIDYGTGPSEYSLNKIEISKSDNGEEEMLAKLKGFENIIQESSKEGKIESQKESSNQREFEYDQEAKKPLPDYAKLKEEAIKQQLRIKEFFSGKPIKKETQEATVIDENDHNTEYNQNLIFKIKETDEEIVRVLPTVDSKSQSEIRRKIFYEKLIKYLEQLLKFSEFNYTAISTNLKNHVKNFVFSLNLTNENIIFTTNEWPIVSLFILKILSMKKGIVNNTFERLVKEDKLIETILSSFKLDQNKLELISEMVINN